MRASTVSGDNELLKRSNMRHPVLNADSESGLGLFGSPNSSPLVFSANFSLSPTNTPIPTFSLHLKPQFGHFSLRKSTFSDPVSDKISGPFSDGGDKVNYGSYSNSGVNLGSESHSNGEFGSGFVSEGSSVWQELKLEPFGGKDGVTNPSSLENGGVHSNGGIGFVPERQLAWKISRKDRFLSGVGVMAKTSFPVTKRLMVNMRWGVNFPADGGKGLPYLTVNKIGIERVEQVKQVKQVVNGGESNEGDSELLKVMCFWMRRDLKALEKENREMKLSLEEMRTRGSVKNIRWESDGLGKNVSPPPGQSSSEFEQWRSRNSGREDNGRRESKETSREFEQRKSKKSGGEENGQRESNKTNRVSDLESELQRAIKAASS
ncbi:uncharacterized protein LOC121235468 [Juglans microcarpa x Juglans regia]|uniref:uncharacterized protein LOC121235468 n=1 Tax=Juglans microcarpa x Juglans regia TaxID=2249226 RepID=UPI001B7E7BCD|nr:uncharacterized protein LOC121235468 [Juglans microcarpa x Juglans regia]